jgi:hypothetical protein
MKKGKKLADIEQVHGKVEKFVPTSLDQIWGADNGLSRFGTLDLDEYEAKLAEMNKADLQEHAVKHGLIPTHERDILKKRLIAEFKRHRADFRRPEVKLPEPKTPSQAITAILGEGR